MYYIEDLDWLEKVVEFVDDSTRERKDAKEEDEGACEVGWEPIGAVMWQLMSGHVLVI